MVKRALLLALLLPGVAAAQTNSNPGWVHGFVPNAAQWNHQFGIKVDGLSGQLVTPSLTTATLIGATSLTGTLSSSGGSMSGTFGGNPEFSGAATFSAAGTALAVTNNATVGGATTLGAGSNNILTVTPGTATSNAVAIRQSGTGGIAFGATGFDVFKLVPNATTTGSTVFTQPSVSTSPFVFSLTGNTGGWSWSGPTTMTNQAGKATLTLSGNATLLSNTFLCGWVCANAFVGGTLTAAVTGAVTNLTVNDYITSSSTNAATVFSFTHNIAPNANSATGNRVALNVLQNILGTSQGGTYTNSGINQAANFAVWVQSNEGGSANTYRGAHTTFGTYCALFSGATFSQGCVGYESDLQAATGSSYIRNTHILLAHLSSNDVQGDMSPDYGILIADQSGALSRGYKSFIQLGNATTTFPSSPNGAFLFVRSGTSPTLSTVIDVSNATMTGCDYRAPFSVSCPIQANSITGATRLTSDGAAASSYVYQTKLTTAGTLYTTNPTITVTGCTGAVIFGQLGSGNVIQDFGVNTAGSACAAEATMSVANAGGVTATGTLVIAGNTLNFPIRSTISVACKVTATNLTHAGTDSVGWSIVFGATMGATASTTAIVGVPVWVLDYETVGASAKFSGAAPATPAADTTYGAINLSITPTSSTWDIGGRCTMTKSAQT